jgi:hypothetical protein
MCSIIFRSLEKGTSSIPVEFKYRQNPLELMKIFQTFVNILWRPWVTFSVWSACPIVLNGLFIMRQAKRFRRCCFLDVICSVYSRLELVKSMSKYACRGGGGKPKIQQSLVFLLLSYWTKCNSWYFLYDWTLIICYLNHSQISGCGLVTASQGCHPNPDTSDLRQSAISIKFLIENYFVLWNTYINSAKTHC